MGKDVIVLPLTLDDLRERLGLPVLGDNGSARALEKARRFDDRLRSTTKPALRKAAIASERQRVAHQIEHELPILHRSLQRLERLKARAAELERMESEQAIGAPSRLSRHIAQDAQAPARARAEPGAGE